MNFKAIIKNIKRMMLSYQSLGKDIHKKYIIKALNLYVMRLLAILIAGVLSGHMTFCIFYFIAFGIIGWFLVNKRKIGSHFDNIIFYFFLILSLLIYLSRIMWGSDIIFAISYFIAAIIINSSKDQSCTLLGGKRGYNRKHSLVCLIVLGFISIIFRYFQKMEVMGGIVTGILGASMLMLVRESAIEEKLGGLKEINVD